MATLPPAPDVELLRSIGQFLDRHHAEHFTIATHDHAVSLTWQLGRRPRSVSHGRLLRALGQRLAQEGIRPVEMHSEGEEFRVTGFSQGRYLQRSYPRAQLDEFELAQQAHRSTPTATDPLPTGGRLRQRWSRLMATRTPRPPR